jgi:hypothetical protein
MSVDPMPFIMQLNRQVRTFNKRLAELSGKDTPIYNNEGAATDELNIENLYAALKRHGIKYPKIVLAQAISRNRPFPLPCLP